MHLSTDLDSRSVLADAILTDGRFLDARFLDARFLDGQRAPLEKAKKRPKGAASRVPVGLRERPPSALWFGDFLRCPVGAFPGIFRLLHLPATLSPRMPGGTQNVGAEFTSKTRPKQEIRGRLLRPPGKTDADRTASKKRTPVKITSAKTDPYMCICMHYKHSTLRIHYAVSNKRHSFLLVSLCLRMDFRCV